jgi:molybdate transport system permease protein
MSSLASRGPRLFARVLAFALLALLALPIAALVATVRGDDFVDAFARGLGTAAWISFGTTTLSAIAIAILGTPLAWFLGRHSDRKARWVDTLVRLPTVTPPAVAGVALLAAFGRGGLFGTMLASIGIRLPFTPMAVVLAQLFVAAPFYVLPAAQAFRELDEELLWAARSLGAGPGRVFFRIALPLAMPALLSGFGVAWARALGEFGATLVFAGNLPGVTQTLPTAIYASMEGDLGPARAMALVLLAWAVVVFALLRSPILGARRS